MREPRIIQTETLRTLTIAGTAGLLFSIGAPIYYSVQGVDYRGVHFYGYGVLALLVAFIFGAMLTFRIQEGKEADG